MLNFTVGSEIVKRKYISTSSSIINGFIFIMSGIIASTLALFTDHKMALFAVFAMLAAVSILNYIIEEIYSKNKIAESWIDCYIIFTYCNTYWIMDYVTTKDITVTKATIAEDINQEIGLSKEDSAAIIDDILDEIKASLVKDGIVKISSFGTFLIKKRKKGQGMYQIHQKKVVNSRQEIQFLLDPQKL